MKWCKNQESCGFSEWELPSCMSPNDSCFLDDQITGDCGCEIYDASEPECPPGCGEGVCGGCKDSTFTTKDLLAFEDPLGGGDELDEQILEVLEDLIGGIRRNVLDLSAETGVSFGAQNLAMCDAAITSALIGIIAKQYAKILKLEVGF